MTVWLAVQVNVAIMLAPVTFLGHITSPAVAALASLQTDQVITDTHTHDADVKALPVQLLTHASLCRCTL